MAHGTSTTRPAAAPTWTCSVHTSSRVSSQPAHISRGADDAVGGSDPFKSYSYLATLTNTWGIDGSIVRFSSWGNYFVWSCMSNSLQSLCIAPLTSPGKIGATKVLSTPTQSWEKNGAPVMEGPAALYYGGKTYIAYSASYCWTAQYSLALLTWNGRGDPSLSASWAKSGPVFTSANSNYGPGHNG